MNNTIRLAAPLVILLAAACSQKSPDSASPAGASAAPPPAAAGVTRQQKPFGAKVFFAGIQNGDTVTSPFKVGFAVNGLKVAPAGTTDPGTGHFHLIIDSDLPPQDAPLPASDTVKHYGKGQTEDTITLPPGPHTLQIEFADGTHLPFDPPVVSDKITVTVK
jgi:uncharacterized protein DUF4399